MTNSLVFDFVSHSVRVVMLSDTPWFVAADVCAALDLDQVTRALSRLDDDETQLIDFSDFISSKGAKNNDLGNSKTNVINESGLYSLILGSRKPEAKKFKRWVTGLDHFTGAWFNRESRRPTHPGSSRYLTGSRG